MTSSEINHRRRGTDSRHVGGVSIELPMPTHAGGRAIPTSLPQPPTRHEP